MEVPATILGLWIAMCLATNPLEVEGARFRIPSLPGNLKSWNCQADNIGTQLNLTALSGNWYEAARVPNVAVMECLNVSVPNEIVNNKLTLGLNYIDTTNGGRSFTNESVDFSWNNSTQHGIFELDFEKVSVTYKLVFTDNADVAFICGYGSISPIPLFKLLTREREISEEKIEIVKNIAKIYGVDSMISWQDQSPGRCNGSWGLTPLRNIFFVIGFVWAAMNL
ncbi:uncharacterized protein [Drosophila bipectinata]|uniref:uncharacterized protein n=1 Tax=Drosophila bipectinata TaxID=42026 RepID=UPI001C893FC5|nr:uncharacterized protein LOC108129371 [Drosophila bipectinata]